MMTELLLDHAAIEVSPIQVLNAPGPSVASLLLFAVSGEIWMVQGGVAVVSN